MRRFWMEVSLAFAVALFAVALPASADTLELKDGRVLHGRYLGGTAAQVRFEINGNVEVFRVREVVALTFTGRSSAASPPSPAASSEPGGVASRESPSADSGTSARGKVTVPAGTRLLVRMIDGVDSSKNHVGDRFHASMETDLVVGDTVVARKGTDLYGRLAEAKQAGHVAGSSELKLELTDMVINGQSYPLMTGDYEAKGKGRGGNTAEKGGGGGAGGGNNRGSRGGGEGGANCARGRAG